jgi:hypothetical protein
VGGARCQLRRDEPRSCASHVLLLTTKRPARGFAAKLSVVGFRRRIAPTTHITHHDGRSHDPRQFIWDSLDPPTVAPSAHAAHPRLSNISKPSIQSELFALGSLLHEVETTYPPFHDKNDGELEDLFGADQFPPTDDLVLGNVVRKCWTVSYLDAGEVVTDIQLIQDRINGCQASSAA